ncbi:MAG: HEAT repeat domain-containing protein [Treponema sp.]|nr:HEAT repeat domain-containing protein [Treponema sp.]
MKIFARRQITFYFVALVFLLFTLLAPLAADDIDDDPTLAYDEEFRPFSQSPFPQSPSTTTPSATTPSGGSAPASSNQVAPPTQTPVSTPAPVAPVAPAARTLEEQRLDTLRFGTETEVAALIQTLRNEKVSYLDDELIRIARTTRNRSILSGIMGFFGDMEKTGLEERAIRAITDRDEEANDTVLAAVDYLGKVKAGTAVDSLEELIVAGEARFLNSAIRALGRLRGDPYQNEDGEVMELTDRTALFLLDYYNNRGPNDENRREIVVALGETGSKEALSFLSGLVKNTNERATLRMAALEALSKVSSDEGLDAVIEAVSSTDPNIRSSAVAALGPYSGELVDNAILEAFRDSYFRTRIGAATAAGQRRLESAVPYLRYRAENDEVPQVRDEAIKALGAINNAEAMGVLDMLFAEKKNSDRVRIAAAEMLLQNNSAQYGSRVLLEMEDAQTRNQTALYNGFVRIMSAAKGPGLEGIAARFLSRGGVIERSLGLDLVLNNELRVLENEVRALMDERAYGASIARKAQSTLEKLGIL